MNKFDIFNNVAISAGAGSGKTYTLSRRYINILVGFNLFIDEEQNRPLLSEVKPALPSEIVTITYIEAGALEMKSRIFSLIQSVLGFIDGSLDKEHDDYKSLKETFDAIGNDIDLCKHIRISLQKSLSELSSATISTIHSYCLDLIESHGDYLKLDAKPTIISDDKKIVAYTDAYRSVLNNEGDLVKIINQTLSLYKLSQIAQKYSFNAQFREAFNTYVRLCAESDFSLHKLWIASILPAYRERIQNGLHAVSALISQDPSKRDYCDMIIVNLLTVLRGDGDWFDYPGNLTKNKKIDEETFNTVKSLRDGIKSLRSTLMDKDAERHYVEVLQSIHKLFIKVYSQFTHKLKEDGYTDFETILQHANALLNHSISIPTRYFMIDEFQDTNSYQWGIVTKAAAKNNANIFIVGDEKQSIFAFQGADVSVFAQASREIGIEKPLPMEVNRRSDRSIIDLVNKVFAPAMAEKEIMRLERIDAIGDTKIDECFELFNSYANQPILKNDFEARYEPLSVPMEQGDGSITILATPMDHTIEECGDECSESIQELRHIASFIHSVVNGELEQYADVKAAYDQGEKAIAVLFDSRKHMLPLKQRLLELGLRAKVSDSGNFFATKEVNDIFIVLKLLTIINRVDWEDLKKKDKYVIVGALRSNIVRCSADEIESYLRSKTLPKILYEWQNFAFYHAPYKLIGHIVEESKLAHLYRNIDGYEQRSANIEQLVNMAYEYSNRRGADLKSFTDELEAFIHNANVSEDEAFIVEEGVGSIEIVTMHGSKGLEWPMVIIGAMNRSFLGMSKQETLVYDRLEDKELIGFKIGDYEPVVYKFIKERITKKHLAERKRLFYVAMTRPEHHLVLSTAINEYGKGPRLCYNCGSNNYFTLLNNVLGLDLEELYLINMDRIGNIAILYPGEWKGVSLTSPSIEIIEKMELAPMEFSHFTFVRPSGIIDPLTFLKEDVFGAGSAGSVVHKILEKHWHELNQDEIYERYFDEYNVPENFKSNIIRMSKAFMESRHFNKLKNGAEAYFEHDFVMMQNGTQIRGSIDLFYYDTEVQGWVIVDFKTTALRGQDAEMVMLKNGYDYQLEFYAHYLESVVGEDEIIAKEICWLNI